jgi:hypothetical protein
MDKNYFLVFSPIAQIARPGASFTKLTWVFDVSFGIYSYEIQKTLQSNIKNLLLNAKLE